MNDEKNANTKIFKAFGVIVLGLIILLIMGFFLFSISASREVPFRVEGVSMREFGFKTDDIINVYKPTLIRKCSVGDICVFHCLSEKCNHSPEEQIAMNGGKYIIKQLKQKNDKCYWFEGNPSGKRTDDSRAYGWLCENDINVIGIVNADIRK